MKDMIEQYIKKAGSQMIIDRSIIGKTIQASDGAKAQVLEAGCDFDGGYVTVKGAGNSYTINEKLFKHFKLID
jgi:hypothetical protein